MLCLLGTHSTTCSLVLAFALATFWVCVVAPRLTPLYWYGLACSLVAKLLWNWSPTSLIAIGDQSWMKVALVHFSMDLWIVRSTIIKVLIALSNHFSSFSFHLHSLVSSTTALAISFDHIMFKYSLELTTCNMLLSTKWFFPSCLSCRQMWQG